MTLLEVQLPVRNPTEVMQRTIDSLLAQTTREFTVVLSDNWSTSGTELIERALAQLREAGIAACKVTPPRELARVEHWNWLHARAEAPWVKPLFVGDWLEPACLERFLAAFGLFPQAGLVHVAYHLHQEGRPAMAIPQVVPFGYRPPAVMQESVLRIGHQFGPPSAYAFSHEAFLAIGGYRPSLPIAADCLFCCTLAARSGVVTIPDLLANFFIHGARFSTGLSARRRATLREELTYHGLLTYHAWTERRAVPWGGVARHAARKIRNYLYGR
ncbi:MAG TPA: hypothetical protein VGO11_04775 [Chthoniobacteraceae bacterium]|jgi:glycosyltransferase involved in cell wall biosynthesis|nr:hypothetical protein [Chthoniobacteraceae bacterium]